MDIKIIIIICQKVDGERVKMCIGLMFARDLHKVSNYIHEVMRYNRCVSACLSAQ